MISAKQLYETSSKLQVLYVEDDELLKQETGMLLESLFGKVDYACDGLDGLEKFHSNLYDVIITDINMPRMNGIEMIEKIREINPEQKVLGISAHSESDILVSLIRAGVTSFILKPIIQQDVLNTLFPVCRDAYAQQLNIQLFEELNDERAKLSEEREKLKQHIKLLEAQTHATDTKHAQVEELLQKCAPQQEAPLLKDYFEKDEDEGEENVVFLKDDCDEMMEMFDEMPELMLQYNLNRDIENVHKVILDLKKIASILLHYTPFLDPLAKSFDDLAITIEENIDAFTEMFGSNPDNALMVWDAVSIDMERYMRRFTEESMAMKNIHHIHHPTTLSIQQIITMVCPPDEDEGDIEFF